MLEAEIAELELRIHLTLSLFDLRAHVPPVPAQFIGQAALQPQFWRDSCRELSAIELNRNSIFYRAQQYHRALKPIGSGMCG